MGTTIEAAAGTSITSRTNKPGETFTATIGEAIKSADGRVVIPAGASVTLSIVALKPAPDKSAKDGTIELKAVSVVINGESRPIDADVTYVQHTLKARGVTGKEAVKVGVGAAAGAIIGKVVGGGTGAAHAAAAMTSRTMEDLWRRWRSLKERWFPNPAREPSRSSTVLKRSFMVPSRRERFVIVPHRRHDDFDRVRAAVDAIDRRF